MNPIQIAGTAVFAVGAVLLYFAYSASQAPLDQISTALTGEHTDRTMLYLILGTIAAVGGGFMALFGRRVA